MNKLFKFFLLMISHFLLISLPVLAIYSFFKMRKQGVNIKDNLQHISQHYFFTFLFHGWNGNRSVMIHAISLGEVDAAMNLIDSFEFKIQSNVILTVTSIQAYKKIKNNNITVLFFPFDSLIHQFLFVCRFNIKKAIIIEHDFWPNFLAVMNLLRREVMVLNGHISDKTMYYLGSACYREVMFHPIKNVYVQTDVLQKKLSHIMPDVNISVAPSYKLPLNLHIQDIENISTERKILTISNFHLSEIDTVNIFLSTLNGLDYKILLVPRHIHSFDDFILALENTYKDQVQVVSECSDVENVLSDIVFVKAYGVLDEIYSISHASIVFGSFDSSLKGHSLFEPLLYGSMVYYGPYFSSQTYMDELLHCFIPNIRHDIDSICQQIEMLTTQDRILIYNGFVNAVGEEKDILIGHFKDVERWIKTERLR